MDIETVTMDELKKLVDTSWEHYTLPVVTDSDGNSWAIAFDDEKREAAIRNYAEETLWMMGAIRLSRCTGLSERVLDKLCDAEDEANEALSILVKGTCGIDAVVEDILEDADYGMHLSSSDGEEVELPCGGYAYLIS